MMIWSCPSVIPIPMSSSSSSSLMALIPLALTFPYADITVFLNSPFLVQNTRYLSSGKSWVVMELMIFSPSSRSGIRLTSGLPLACLLPSGILYPFSHCMRPLLVMKRM